MKTLHADIEEKKTRIEKIKSDMKSANHDERVTEKAGKARTMEDRREELNAELRSLSLQADSRARFDIKRSEVKSKTGDIRNMSVQDTLSYL
jgi:DNA repair protein RAD50